MREVETVTEENWQPEKIIILEVGEWKRTTSDMIDEGGPKVRVRLLSGDERTLYLKPKDVSKSVKLEAGETCYRCFGERYVLDR